MNARACADLGMGFDGGMPDFRVYAPSENADAKDIVLSRAESHHLVAVNRAWEGDPVVAFDGCGREWFCELREASKTGARLEVKSSRMAAGVKFRITLAQALPKGTAMDGIVRKATEIGAVRIVPLETERTQVHFDEDRGGRKLEKWQVAALEAAKQCGNAWLPEIASVRRLADFLKENSGGLKLAASLHGGSLLLKKVLADFQKENGRLPDSAVWLVGPEGDFSEGEMRAIVGAGFLPVTLGPLVLRCETAATYALSVLSHELGG